MDCWLFSNEMFMLVAMVHLLDCNFRAVFNFQFERSDNVNISFRSFKLTAQVDGIFHK